MRQRSIGVYLTHVAVALYLVADGILGLVARNGKFLSRLQYQSEIEDVLLKLLGRGDLANALIVIFSVLAVIGGVFLLLELFSARLPIVSLILLVFLVVWLVFIVLVDLIGPFKDNQEFLPWLKTFAAHIMVLGALVTASRRFGD